MFLNTPEKQTAAFSVLCSALENLSSVSSIMNILRDNVFEYTANYYIPDEEARPELFRVFDSMGDLFTIAFDKIDKVIALIEIMFPNDKSEELQTINKDIAEFIQLANVFKK